MLLCTAAVVETQQQNIVSSSRSVNWSNAGVTGGIPNRTTVCATLNPGATVTQINSAIAACPANQVVKLNPGIYLLAGGIDFAGKSNVTLRGAGANQTFLTFTNDTSCLGQTSNICMRGSNLSYYGPGPPTRVVNWTAGYAKGSTSVTLSATTGLAVGMRMVLDQLNDAVDTGNIFVCQSSSCTQQGGTTNGQPNRAQHQIVTVTGISGTTVTFTPSLYMPNYRASRSPQAWWGTSSGLASGIGVEDLSMDTTAGQAHAGAIELIFVYDSWVKGVRVVNCPTPKSCVGLYHVDHVTVRDSYFYGSNQYAVGSTTYGVDLFGTADTLIENNIFQHRTSPFVANGDQGSVIAYNYSIDDYYSVSPAWMQASQYSHEGGNGMILQEGNEGIGIKGDIIHATSNLFTFFRNYMHGWEPGKTAETSPVNLYAYNRFWNFVGNVLGEAGYHNAYEANSQTAIYRFGRDYSNVPFDPIAASTMMRWGNHDVVTGTKFNAAEVPSGLPLYGNPVPATQTLPASFYLSAKPSWWGSIPWPAIGPDVTGGNVANVGGHVYKIPARLCYETTAKDANGILIGFNPNTCYGATPTTLSAPRNLRVVGAP
jgi:hypothetical protein